MPRDQTTAGGCEDVADEKEIRQVVFLAEYALHDCRASKRTAGGATVMERVIGALSKRTGGVPCAR